jgi:hypothetical protein
MSHNTNTIPRRFVYYSLINVTYVTLCLGYLFSLSSELRPCSRDSHARGTPHRKAHRLQERVAQSTHIVLVIHNTLLLNDYPERQIRHIFHKFNLVAWDHTPKYWHIPRYCFSQIISKADLCIRITNRYQGFFSAPINNYWPTTWLV